MVRQVFHIKHYWKVIVYYNLDYNFFSIVENDLYNYGATSSTIAKIYDSLYSKEAKALTYSNFNRHISIVIFNKHSSKEDYINSIIHEAEHIKQAILQEYGVLDEGEDAAYTIGYIVMRMYQTYKYLT